jgi:TolB protein
VRRFLVCFLVLVVLAACGGPATPPPLPTTPPLPVTTAEADDVNLPQPTIEVENPAEVPGKLLFVLSGGDIWAAEGDSTHSITRSGKKYQPAWSPDGRRIAYVQREESFSDLWVMDSNGSNKVRITNNEPAGIDARSEDHILSITWAFYPRWSRDGSLLAYMSQLTPPRPTGGEVPSEYPLSLYLYGSRRIAEGSLAGPSFQRLVKADIDLSHPTWSADDQLLVYAQSERCYSASCPDAGAGLGFYVPETDASGDLAGADPAQFNSAMDPAFSPDGAWLAYVKDDGAGSDIWVVPAPELDGTVSGAPIRLTSTGRSRMPTWSPDGSKLAYFVAKDNLISLTVSDVAVVGKSLSLSNAVEIRKDPIDVDSGMSWVR